MSRLLPELKAYAIAITKDEELAKDLVQEACQKTLSAKRVPDRAEDLKPWMFRIIRNLFIDHKRREKTASEYFDSVSRLYENTPASNPAVIEELLVRQALERLSEQEREILYLIDVFELKYAEAAVVLGIAQGTIMSRISRARRALLQEVESSNVQRIKRKSLRK
ncbi:RNA polymerase sigma factor [Sneathiella limimaris]|uniref:RNA polymerase sigma factor n=1 Tax=Sneathiella limimaris TaxID=1964213 RepID=UPI00146DEA05|nr:RNA polymerase sigma factor [Sneathiella limimaris]